MGYFSYICPCCNENIREDENVVQTGPYDGYGRIAEDSRHQFYHRSCVEKLMGKTFKELGPVKRDPNQGGGGAARPQHLD